MGIEDSLCALQELLSSEALGQHIYIISQLDSTWDLWTPDIRSRATITYFTSALLLYSTFAFMIAHAMVNRSGIWIMRYYARFSRSSIGLWTMRTNERVLLPIRSPSSTWHQAAERHGTTWKTPVVRFWLRCVALTSATIRDKTWNSIWYSDASINKYIGRRTGAPRGCCDAPMNQHLPKEKETAA